jgi:hypothetical protein
MSSMIANGGCYCNAVRYHIDGEPMMKALCYCRECQHASGGNPSVILMVPKTAFTYTSGAPVGFARTDLESPVTREFCGTCGTPLASHTPRAPDAVLVKAGTLDDPTSYGLPYFAVHLDEAQAYHKVPDEIREFGGQPKD